MNNPVIDQFGNKFWYNELGQLHREDGPAVEYKNGSKYWYKHNKLHREDGPAKVFINGRKGYWINGIKYDSLEQGLMDQALA